MRCIVQWSYNLHSSYEPARIYVDVNGDFQMIFRARIKKVLVLGLSSNETKQTWVIQTNVVPIHNQPPLSRQTVTPTAPYTNRVPS